MRFNRITGVPQVLQCSGCLKEYTAGSPPYQTASGRQLDTVYQNDAGVTYCEACAAKHAEGTDTTKAVTMFYADTRGDTIL